MASKSIILSSAGLKNIIFDSSLENLFCFHFGDCKIVLNQMFAEFISPVVSRLKKTDSTIESIYFNDIFDEISNFYQISYHDLFTEDIISLIKQLSSGFSVTIDQKQSVQLQLISIFLDNEELYNKINEIYPIDINESNIDYYLQYIQLFKYFSTTTNHFNFSNIIDFISSHFYSIDEEKLVRLPKSILYLIISNQQLKIESEDSLLNFIEIIFLEENDEKGEKLTINDFYEFIEFSGLSESKFHEFITSIKFDEMTNSMWNKFCHFLCKSAILSSEKLKENRYYRSPKNNTKNSESIFKGIIYQLTVENGGKNVHDEAIIDVSSSSTLGFNYAKYAVDFDDKNHFFESCNVPNSWLRYDFIDKKVRPNKYSIRSRHDRGKGGCHLSNWVIEGSNSRRNDEWEILDERNDVTILDDKNAEFTFTINPPLDENEFYRYLRIRQTGDNTEGNDHMALSALEFYGLIV